MRDAPTRSTTAARATVLGTGAIGTAVAGALARSGVEVTVWNRSPGRTRRAVEDGAVAVASTAEAVIASPLVLLCLTDYRAVLDVLTDAGTALGGRTVVVLTTGSPDEARRAADTAERAGAQYVDGGVQSAPDDIGGAAATLLYSGSRTGLDAHRGTLGLLGAVRDLGADPAAAAVHDLALFGLWYDAQLGYLRALETVGAAGIDLEDFAATAAVQLGYVAGAAHATADEVVTATFPRGPADLGEHLPVLDRLVELRRDLRLGDGDLDRVRARVRERIDSGHGREGLTSLLG